MIEYRVRSGQMDETVRAFQEADPMTIATMAVDRTAARLLGRLIEVTGGQCVDGQETYISSEQLLGRMGRIRMCNMAHTPYG